MVIAFFTGSRQSETRFSDSSRQENNSVCDVSHTEGTSDADGWLDKAEDDVVNERTALTNSIIAPPLDNTRRFLLFSALIPSIFFSNPYLRAFSLGTAAL